MWLKIQRVSLNNFGLVADGSILTKLFQTTCREAGPVITCVQLLEWEGQKRTNFGAIFDNFRL